MPAIIWKGHLTFGLVSIPINLFRAARRERVRLHYVHRAEVEEQMPDASVVHPGGLAAKAADQRSEKSAAFTPRAEPEPPPSAPVTRVRQALITSDDQQPITRAETLKGYEVEPDRYVVFEQQELKSLQRRTSPNMEIVRSVRLTEIDPVFLETSYYVVPDKGGEKAYALLFAALHATGRVALARVGMYGREHVVIVRTSKHGMLAHTMFYTDEIRFENEYRTDVQSVGPKELELAKTFLKAIEAPFAPEEFKDQYREELQAMIAKKRDQAEVSPAGPASAKAPPMVDILAALKKTIEMTKKSAASEAQPPRKAPARVTEMKGKRPSRKVR
jgi:DNA end-binding protein Ku